jgi:CheY-like chemotaxis protein
VDQSTSVRGGPRVLVVDDNQDAGDLLAETLISAGYETTVVYDGPAALRSVAASPPDVALIDIGLPVMDGYELAARLREDRPASQLRLIALTGYGQESDRERSRKVGFDFHLVKPVDFDMLQRAIEEIAE